MAGASEAVTREWVVMLHARSAVRLRGDAVVNVEAASDSTIPVDAVRLRNGFFRSTDGIVFKGLIAEARGSAASAEDAVSLLAPLAAPYLHMASTAGNGSVDEPEHLLVYAPPSGSERGWFLEQVPADRPTPAATVRSVDVDDFASLLGPLLEHEQRERLHRAMAHYRHALAALDPFNRVISAEHLWMACENLGQVIFRRVCAQAGLPANGETKHKLAVDAGFAPVEGSRKHLYDFDSALRVAEIFDGDKPLNDALRRASDGFEHGFASFADVQAEAHASVDRAFPAVRRAILTAAGVAARSGLLDGRYDAPLGGWQPRLEVVGEYDEDPCEGWPHFYGASVLPEMVAIKDLDDDQARAVTFRAEASGKSLLQGQRIDVHSTTWEVPLTPGHRADFSGEDVVVTRGEGRDREDP